MGCPACGWSNPPHFTHCHQCKAALPVQAGVDAGVMPASLMQPAGVLLGMLAACADAAFALLILLLALFDHWWLSRLLGLGGEAFLLRWAVFALAAWLVLPLMDRSPQGTPGKRLFGLHLVRADGRAAGFGRAFVRTLVLHITHLTLPVFMLFLEARILRRPLHDRLSGLYLVQPEELRSPVLRKLRELRGHRSALWTVLFFLFLVPQSLALLALLTNFF